VINALDSAIESTTNDNESSINTLVFAGRIADELSFSSPFVSSIVCSDDVACDFRKKTRVLYDRTIDRWRIHTVARCVDKHWQNFRPTPNAVLSASLEPSVALIQSLLSLSTSVQQLGLSRDPARRELVAEETLRHFIVNLLHEPDDETKGWEIGGRQALQDLKFLRKFASLWGDRWSETSDLVDEHIARAQKRLRHAESDKNNVEDPSEHLIRTQTLFAPLLPHTSLFSSGGKSSVLLPFGTPSLEIQFQAPVELAKPSSRFGLLLVGDGTR